MSEQIEPRAGDTWELDGVWRFVLTRFADGEWWATKDGDVNETRLARLDDFGKAPLLKFISRAAAPAVDQQPQAATCMAPAWCGMTLPEIRAKSSADAAYYSPSAPSRVLVDEADIEGRRCCSDSCATRGAAGTAICPGCVAGIAHAQTTACKPANNAATTGMQPCKRCGALGPCRCNNAVNAAKGTAVECIGCRKVLCVGEYLSCRAIVRDREPTGKTTLAESKLPDLLPKARLARDEMQEASWLEDA